MVAEPVESLGLHFREILPVRDVQESLGEITLRVNAEDIVRVLTTLRDDERFRMLIDLSAVDFPEREARFEVVYHLLSISRNRRLRIKVDVGEDGAVPTASGVFPAANWYEREVWDLFGIPFEGHPDLRRILTDYGFRGHPLRRDFPLSGHVEVRYDDTRKRVVQEPVRLDQAFRQFDFDSPREGEPGTRAKR